MYLTEDRERVLELRLAYTCGIGISDARSYSDYLSLLILSYVSSVVIISVIDFLFKTTTALHWGSMKNRNQRR